MGEGAIPPDGDVLVDPAIGTKADGVGDGKVEASVPVDDDQNVQHHLADPEGVGEVCASLSLVEELHHPRNSAGTTLLKSASRRKWQGDRIE